MILASSPKLNLFADLSKWLQFAFEYFHQQRYEEFETMLEAGTSPEVEQHYREDKINRIAFLNAYAAYKISLIQQQHPDKAELVNQVNVLIKRASQIDGKTNWTIFILCEINLTNLQRPRTV